jgi:hypothetical protein
LCIDHYQLQQMKGRLPPQFCISFKWIMWQHLVWSLHTILVVQHCSWFYFKMCSPLDVGASTSTSSWAVVRKNTSGMSFHWMAKRWSHYCDIFRLFSVLQKNVCLGTSFLLDITVPTAFVLQPHKWSKIFGTGEPAIDVHTVTLPFYHTTCQQHWTPCCILSW